jgi:hypothetical protein
MTKSLPDMMKEKRTPVLSGARPTTEQENPLRAQGRGKSVQDPTHRLPSILMMMKK